MLLRRIFLSLFLFSIIGCVSTDDTAKIKIKTVIVTLFEPEREAIIKKLDLNQTIPFEQGYLPLKTNNKGVLLITTGVGNTRAAAALMGLGMDNRFDLSKAYFIVSGIAGGDPSDVSLGSVVIEDYLVNGDLKHSIDVREMPSDWDFGTFPIHRKKPYEKPVSKAFKNNEYYHLNMDLVKWAYEINKNIQLAPESDSLLKKKSFYTSFPNTQASPKVMIGSGLDAEDFWHGSLKTKWANEWVKYFTEGKGNFMATAMEGAGVLQSIHFLSHAHKLQENKVLMFRSISNFSMPGNNISPYENLIGEESSYSAFQDSLENLARVVKHTLEEITENWDEMKDKY